MLLPYTLEGAIDSSLPCSELRVIIPEDHNYCVSPADTITTVNWSSFEDEDCGEEQLWLLQ